MCAAFYYEKNGPNFVIGASLNESTSLCSLPYLFDKRHYKKDSRFVNDLYTLTYDDHESLDSVRLFSTFANQVSVTFSGDFSTLFCNFALTKQWSGARGFTKADYKLKFIILYMYSCV